MPTGIERRLCGRMDAQGSRENTSEEKILTKAGEELECGCYRQCGNFQNGSIYVYPNI